ncbi:MAG TPA: D-alanyl-D-alanine carboxypeptidase/D-alanyl-D-alanine-endopeptidase [Acidimicrobiales bacterium]|nr:D-alanyl-D-alanine carboxypeptidase/D-alanyl-D-alanine-endopeptidase [Acidimicrobiales bacterium]
MIRRALVPAVLALVFVLSAVATVAAALGPRSSGDREGAEGSRLRTPVLSARRVPELLSRTVAHVRLGADLDAAMDVTGRTCLTVEEGDTAIYGRNGDDTLTPASTLKVLTGMAALRRLGDDFTFVTPVVAAAPVGEGGVVDGPLWLVGAGDPLLSTVAYAASFRNQPQVHTSMDALADGIVAAGVREVRGGVLGDESRFDTVRYVPTWKPGYITDNEIGPVSALVVNDNFAQFRPRRTIATPEPPVHGAVVLTELLRARGVIVVPEGGAGVAPPQAVDVASVKSPPLPEIVGELLRESDNMTAEVLTKELGVRFGAGGTWAAGTDVIRETVAEAGLPAGGYSAVDGSGLDVSNRLSCTLLMDALDLAGPVGPVASGFAVAGRTGTLAQRFLQNPAEGRLRAKTGSLNNVVGLVGFVDAADERTLEFALLANDLPSRLDAGRALQERVGAVLARYPRAPVPATIEPKPPARR